MPIVDHANVVLGYIRVLSVCAVTCQLLTVQWCSIQDWYFCVPTSRTSSNVFIDILLLWTLFYNLCSLKKPFEGM